MTYGIYSVGKKSNRQVAEMVTAFVLDTIDGLAKSTAVIDGRTGTKTPYINSFRNAAANRIWFRCQELIEESQEEIVSEWTGTTLPALTSLYQVEKAANKDWISLNLKLKTGGTRGRSSSQAGIAGGHAAGNNVSLRPGVSNQTRKGISKC